MTRNILKKRKRNRKNQNLRIKWKVLGKNHLIDIWKIYSNDKKVNAEAK